MIKRFVEKFHRVFMPNLTARMGSRFTELNGSVYDGYVSLERFQEIAEEASRPVKRVVDYYTSEGKAVFTVNSISNISQWRFWVDFNDRGRITGSCTWNSENSDSDIPDRVANEMHRLVNQAIAEERLRLELEAEREKRAGEEQTRHAGYVDSSENTVVFYCKICGQRLSVPRMSETLKTRCPNCGHVKFI